jgi:hypothetical protein
MGLVGIAENRNVDEMGGRPIRPNLAIDLSQVDFRSSPLTNVLVAAVGDIMGKPSDIFVFPGLELIAPDVRAMKSTNDRKDLLICAVSLDHLVGNSEHAGGNCEAERLGSFEVEDEFEFGGLLDWQLPGLLTFQNPPGIAAPLTIRFDFSGAVAHQTTGGGEVSPIVNRGYCVACGQRREPFAPREEN